MKISRSDKLYVEIDKIENHSVQYQIFLELMRLRYFFNTDPKENKSKYIEHTKITSNKILELSHDRDFFTMKCTKSEDKIFKDFEEYFIKDYAYYNKPNYQIWVNIDFSLPNEMLIAQIAQLKEDIDKDTEMQAFFKSQETEYTKEFISKSASIFSREIKRQYGDFLFVIDSKELGYKNQDIIYSIYDYRQKKNTISQDTIRKYIKLQKEAYMNFSLQD